MPEIGWDKEGNAIHADDDEQRRLLAAEAGPGITEKNNRIRELKEQKRELNEKITAISKEQEEIIHSLVTGIEPEAKKNPMDMTLDELYEAYLKSILNTDLKLNRKEMEKTESRNKRHKEQISKNIDTAERMLKALNLCVKCNVRSRANQWAKYCHAPCTPEREISKEPSPPRLAAPPTVRQMILMFNAKRNAEE